MNFSKKSLLVLLSILYYMKGHGQPDSITTYRTLQLETMAEKKDAQPEDDSYELDLESFRRYPLNLNTAKEEEFIMLHMLDNMQLRNFLSYRKLLGALLSVHELQAIPGWDIETIHRILPFIMIGRDESVYSALRERWKGGGNAFLVRAGQVLEKSKGFEKPSSPQAAYYQGSAQKIFIRYTYNYKQLLAFGFTGEKDAGEPFLRAAQKYGFDFYSFHFFLQRVGLIRALALGDFTVNLGQGLIQWQTISFTKSSQALAVKREANCFRPYHSAGEFNFHRGAAISLQKGKWQMNVFIASQKMSTNTEPDTAGGEDHFSSFQNSGYHRTEAEIKNRNNSRRISAGGNIRHMGRRLTWGFNLMHFQFSRPFQKREEPYNFYSLRGRRLLNTSVDYSYTLGNLHLFGELAADKWNHIALVQGALISLHENMDMSFLYRNISPAYQSLFSDAFTESSMPNNEKGFYTGLCFRPANGLQADLYYDVFVFPWLRYGVDGPSHGRDMAVQINFQPNKLWRLTLLYKNERKKTNAGTLNMATHELHLPVKQRWRLETYYTVSRAVAINSRMEFLWLKEPGIVIRRGFLGMAGLSYGKSGFSGNIGGVVFETGEYASRIYAYEPDLRYNFSLPAFFGRGIHYYINLHKDFHRLNQGMRNRFRLSGWLKWSQTIYTGAGSIGSGLDEIGGNRKSEIKAQVLVEWQRD